MMYNIFDIMSAKADTLQEDGMSRLHGIAGMTAAALLAAGPALAQHEHAAPAPTTTANLQGDEGHSWAANPNIRAFYELSKARLGPGAGKLDFKDYERRSMAIFDQLGASMGWKPGLMRDHLKLIPGQTVQIVKEDPHVLDNYENFITAMLGPT
jgi:hypothetical protein